MTRTDWTGLMELGRRRFAAYLAMTDQPAVEPTPGEAARIAVARGRVQAEHDAVLAEVDESWGRDRVTTLLAAIDGLVPRVEQLERRAGVDNAHVLTSRDLAVWTAELRTLLDGA